MINKIHSVFHRPEKGWDPVPAAHAKGYAAAEWANFDARKVDELEERIGGLRDKAVLDLGGGPGHYSVEFAKRGARVTWHDISRNYLAIAQRHAAEAGVEMEYSLGYLEDAKRLARRPYDLVFNRICWNYCMNDSDFARTVYALAKPGGAVYVDTMTCYRTPHSARAKMVNWLYKNLGVKVGHPFPARGRVGEILKRLPNERFEEERTETNDRISLVKKRTNGRK